MFVSIAFFCGLVFSLFISLSHFSRLSSALYQKIQNSLDAFHIPVSITRKPDMDRLVATQKLRKNVQTRDIPVIALSERRDKWQA